MRVVATVLYEDQAKAGKAFPFHTLVLATLADRTSLVRWQLAQQVDGRPMKGASNLYRSAVSDAGKIAADGRWVLAVFDEDRFDDLCAQQRLTEHDTILTRSTLQGRPQVYKLERNLESVVQVICDLMPELEHLRSQACGKKLLVRDRVLNAAAVGDKVAVREHLCQRVPSFGRIVGRLVELLALDAGRGG